eukprot:Filipodium_phascolosomae@DN2410_c0_g1_i1.p1
MFTAESQALWKNGEDSMSTLNEVSGGWITKSEKLLERLKKQNVEIFIVTSGHLIPTLLKLVIAGLHKYIPAGNIYSSVSFGKEHCFREIIKSLKERTEETKAPYTSWAVVAVGDGEEERLASSETGMNQFVRVESITDLEMVHQHVCEWVEQ